MELVSENKLAKNGKYYKLNIKLNSETLTGEIDFGKDGRIVVRSEDTINVKSKFKIHGSKSMNFSVGDKVKFKIINSKEGDLAQVLQVIDPGKKFVNGRFENHKYYGLVFPYSRDIKKEILISADDINKAKHGDKVYIEILNYDDLKDEFSDLRGKVIEVLGKP